jgi:catechol 2,3-dioxygenase-like lactoylglutathione lyase family enzyme
VAIRASKMAIGVVVQDIAAALRFYCDGVGLEHRTTFSIPEPHGGGTVYLLGCAAGVVKLIDPAATLPDAGERVAFNQSYGIRYWTLHVEGLDRIADSCRELGSRFVLEPHDTASGGRMCALEDPDGNMLELVQSGAGDADVSS